MNQLKYRNQFPIFSTQDKLVYLDSAATALKPTSVIASMSEYYSSYSANIHRGLYPIALKATDEFDSARIAVKNLIHASSANEIVFTKGATESLNLIAHSVAKIIPKNSEILTTICDHHSNFVPWQQVAKIHDLKFGVMTINPLTVTEELLLQVVRDSVTEETSVLALPLVTNVFGVIFPVKAMIKVAREKNPDVLVVIDACQAVAHCAIDVVDIDADFLVFSGHKMFGPTGVGVMYGKSEMLARMPPYQFGGDMISEVTIEATAFNDAPSKFEAGTPPIGEVVGLKSAISFIQEVTLDVLKSHARELQEYAVSALKMSFGDSIQLYTPRYLQSSSIINFNLKDCHAHDVAQILAENDVCVRGGHHCAQPLHDFLSIPASCRASVSIYNTTEDIDQFIAHLKRCFTVLGNSI